MVLDDENDSGIFHSTRYTDQEHTHSDALPSLSWDVRQAIATLARQNRGWGPKRILKELQLQNVNLDMVKAVLADLKLHR
ncbi:hypothetical protein HII36_26760 [Nonomuraea sp. NN258]|uniref:hypothetical protein n=1 Tax=Nonomuraea antri TaxID=2730852 RepID=UPI0015694E04|nr:hypothetical protein [Nonomuraea antri]NRQ35403.1 hypothetical protein [Nonomuraea antri]